MLAVVVGLRLSVFLPGVVGGLGNLLPLAVVVVVGSSRRLTNGCIAHGVVVDLVGFLFGRGGFALVVLWLVVLSVSRGQLLSAECTGCLFCLVSVVGKP